MTAPISEDYGNPYAGLANIAGAVASIVQPYKGIELALKGLIAKNPDVAQQFANLEYLQPGSTGIFGPNAQSYFSTLAPSPQALVQKSAREELPGVLDNPDVKKFLALKTGAGATPGDIQEDKYKGAIAQSTLQAFLENPQLAQAAVARKATGKLPGDVAKSMALAYGLDEKTVSDVYNNPDLPGGYLKYLLGEQGGLTAQEVNAAFSLPVGQSLKDGLRIYLERQRNDLLMKLGTMKISAASGEREDLLNKAIIMNSFDLANKIGGNVNPADVLAIRLGPDNPIVQRLGGSSPDRMQTAQQGLNAIRDQMLGKGKTGKGMVLNSMVKQYLKAKADGEDPSTLQAIVNNMNVISSDLGIAFTADADNGKLYSTDLFSGQILTEDQLKMGGMFGADVPVLQAVPGHKQRYPTVVTPPNTAPVGSEKGGGKSSRVSVSGPAGVVMPTKSGFDIDKFVSDFNKANARQKQVMLDGLKKFNVNDYKAAAKRLGIMEE